MPENHTFADLMARLRAGDAAAAEELVRTYEGRIRTIVRVRLSPSLRRVFDSMDIYQSVMGSFYPRARAGQYELRTPDQLVALLVRMAQNKLVSRARHHFSLRRDCRKSVTDAGVLDALPGPPDPGKVVADRELSEKVLGRLGPEERRLAELRVAGWKWEDIAVEMGGTVQGRRKQFERAIARVTAELGLTDPDGEKERPR